MQDYQFRVDSPRDVAVQANQMSRAIVGQIHRTRGESPKQVAEFAVDAWEKIATKDYVLELATNTIPGAAPADVIARLRRDVLIYLNDCLQMDRGAAQTIGAARKLVGTAIEAVLRHA